MSKIYRDMRQSYCPIEYIRGKCEPSSSFHLEPVSPSEISNTIQGLNNISPGIDRITTNILLTCSDYIIQPITIRTNQSFSTGIFPDHLKLSIATPLHINGSKNILNNY